MRKLILIFMILTIICQEIKIIKKITKKNSIDSNCNLIKKQLLKANLDSKSLDYCYKSDIEYFYVYKKSQQMKIDIRNGISQINLKLNKYPKRKNLKTKTGIIQDNKLKIGQIQKDQFKLGKYKYLYKFYFISSDQNVLGLGPQNQIKKLIQNTNFQKEQNIFSLNLKQNQLIFGQDKKQKYQYTFKLQNKDNWALDIAAIQIFKKLTNDEYDYNFETLFYMPAYLAIDASYISFPQVQLQQIIHGLLTYENIECKIIKDSMICKNIIQISQLNKIQMNIQIGRQKINLYFSNFIQQCKKKQKKQICQLSINQSNDDYIILGEPFIKQFIISFNNDKQQINLFQHNILEQDQFSSELVEFSFYFVGIFIFIASIFIFSIFIQNNYFQIKITRRKIQQNLSKLVTKMKNNKEQIEFRSKYMNVNYDNNHQTIQDDD